MKYEIMDVNISNEAYRYLISADSPSTPQTVTVIYDRVYNIHSLDLRMLVSQFRLKIKELP